MANKRHSKEWRITPGKITHPRSKVSGNEGGYKEFRIGDLFGAQTGDVDLQQKDINGNGCFFINSGVDNQGIKGKTDKPAKIFSANTITVDFWGNAYYRAFLYKMATHNHVFSLSGKCLKNEKIGLFITSQMSYLKKLFSYNNMGTWPRIREQLISLPTKSNGEIDFGYMEKFIEQIENERWNYLDQFLDEAGLQNCILTPKENFAIRDFFNNKILFKIFKLVDVFTVKNTHSILKTDIEYNSGNDPYVTASEENNSVVTFISYNKDLIEEGNSIMIGGKTLTITYQSKDYYSNDSHNLALYLKTNKHRTENIQLFLVSVLKNCLRNTYSWNDSISFKKIQKDEIGLPVTSSGDIDYEFMENFISAYKKKTIQNLYKWREEKNVELSPSNVIEYDGQKHVLNYHKAADVNKNSELF